MPASSCPQTRTILVIWESSVSAGTLVPLHSDYRLFERVGIGTAHFGAGFGGCEHPFDAGGSGVSLSFPRGDFANGAFRVVNLRSRH